MNDGGGRVSVEQYTQRGIAFIEKKDLHDYCETTPLVVGDVL